MSQRSGPSPLLSLLQSRAVAIAIMLAGAAGFLASLILFNEQVLCMFGSTLLVFLGLWWNIRARRAGQGPPGGIIQPQTETSGAAGSRPQARWQGPSLSIYGAQEAEPAVEPYEEPEEPHLAEPEPIEIASPLQQVAQYPPQLLTQQLLERLRALEAHVTVEAEHADRAILLVRAWSGETHTIMALEGAEPVGVPELRALAAMRTAHRSRRALMVSGSSFTRQAIEWAQNHGIDLLDGDQVDLLEL